MKIDKQFIIILILFYISFIYFNNSFMENYSADANKYSSWITKAKNNYSRDDKKKTYDQAMNYQPYDQHLNSIFSKTKKYDLDYLSNTIFKPECCPSNYTSSAGCACLTPEQLTYISKRGGNNHAI